MKETFSVAVWLAMGACVLMSVPMGPLYSNWNMGRCKTHHCNTGSLLQTAQANNHIWLHWQGLQHRPMRKHGDHLEEKSMATANTSESQSRDKVAFCPIK